MARLTVPDMGGDVLARLRATTVALRERESLLDHRGALVAQARREGHRWDVIAEAMGVTRQSAKTAEQRYKARSSGRVR